MIKEFFRVLLVAITLMTIISLWFLGVVLLFLGRWAILGVPLIALACYLCHKATIWLLKDIDRMDQEHEQYMNDYYKNNQ